MQTDEKLSNRGSMPRMAKESSTSLPLRIVSGVLTGGVLLSAVLPFASAFNTPSSSDALVESKLSKVPIFTVTDSTGRPFLTEAEDHRFRMGYFFVQPADAEAYLKTVQQESTQANDAKVLTITLNEAYKFLERRTNPAKSIPEKFELFPDNHEADLAQELTDGAFEQQFGKSGVPIFYLDGLAVKDNKDGTPVYPLFFEKEKLDETLSNLKKANPSSDISLKDLQIIDLQQTIREIRGGRNPTLNSVVFIPMDVAMQKMRAASN